MFSRPPLTFMGWTRVEHGYSSLEARNEHLLARAIDGSAGEFRRWQCQYFWLNIDCMLLCVELRHARNVSIIECATNDTLVCSGFRFESVHHAFLRYFGRKTNCLPHLTGNAFLLICFIALYDAV